MTARMKPEIYGKDCASKICQFSEEDPFYEECVKLSKMGAEFPDEKFRKSLKAELKLVLPRKYSFWLPMCHQL
jgi:hypothetical protein